MRIELPGHGLADVDCISIGKTLLTDIPSRLYQPSGSPFDGRLCYFWKYSNRSDYDDHQLNPRNVAKNRNSLERCGESYRYIPKLSDDV